MTFSRASDLQLGDEKFTLNHRDYVFQAINFVLVNDRSIVRARLSSGGKSR